MAKSKYNFCRIEQFIMNLNMNGSTSEHMLYFSFVKISFHYSASKKNRIYSSAQLRHTYFFKCILLSWIIAESGICSF